MPSAAGAQRGPAARAKVAPAAPPAVAAPAQGRDRTRGPAATHEEELAAQRAGEDARHALVANARVAPSAPRAAERAAVAAQNAPEAAAQAVPSALLAAVPSAEVALSVPAAREQVAAAGHRAAHVAEVAYLRGEEENERVAIQVFEQALSGERGVRGRARVARRGSERDARAAVSTRLLQCRPGAKLCEIK